MATEHTVKCCKEECEGTEYTCDCLKCAAIEIYDEIQKENLTLDKILKK